MDESSRSLDDFIAENEAAIAENNARMVELQAEIARGQAEIARGQAERARRGNNQSGHTPETASSYGSVEASGPYYPSEWSNLGSILVRYDDSGDIAETSMRDPSRQPWQALSELQADLHERQFDFGETFTTMQQDLMRADFADRSEYLQYPLEVRQQNTNALRRMMRTMADAGFSRDPLYLRANNTLYQYLPHVSPSLSFQPFDLNESRHQQSGIATAAVLGSSNSRRRPASTDSDEPPRQRRRTDRHPGQGSGGSPRSGR